MKKKYIIISTFITLFIIIFYLQIYKEKKIKYLKVKTGDVIEAIYGLGKIKSDDIFEVNDTPETATVLRSTNSERISGLTIHNEADEDFFKFELTTAASPNDAVNVYFEHDLGDIDVELYPTESGNLEYFSNGYSSTDNEALSLAGLPAGEYYVKVYGYAGATNTYELQFNINTN